jgi:hypothetical protein
MILEWIGNGLSRALVVTLDSTDGWVKWDLTLRTRVVHEGKVDPRRFREGLQEPAMRPATGEGFDNV